MNKKWIASLASVYLLASSCFTAAMAEGMKPGETPQAKAVEERFRKFAHENGMNQKQFQALYGFFDGIIGDSRKTAMTAAKAAA